MMRGFALAVSILAFAAGNAAAEEEAGEACPYGPAILSAAEFLLLEPAEKPNFWRDHYAVDAAYLTIRYGGGSVDQADALLASLEGRSPVPERMADLRQAHATTAARQALIAAIEPDKRYGTALFKLSLSTLRTLVLEDGGEWLIAEMKRWAEAQPDKPAPRHVVEQGIARSIADVDDASKAGFAKAAEASGLWRLAFFVHAFRDNLGDLVELIERAPPGGLIESDSALTPDQRKVLWKLALSTAEIRPSFDIKAQPIPIRTIDTERAMGASYRQFHRLAASFTEASTLMAIFNDTGEKRIATELVPELLAGIADGRLDPVKRPDVMVAAMIDGLDRILGREAREKALHTVRLHQGTGPTEFADVYADRMIASAALAPMLEDAPAPERPAALTSKFAWDDAVKTAGQLAAGQPINADDWLMAAELLSAVARYGDAIDLLAESGSLDARTTAHALMVRLDGACTGWLAPTLPLGESVFRFIPR